MLLSPVQQDPTPAPLSAEQQTEPTPAHSGRERRRDPALPDYRLSERSRSHEGPLADREGEENAACPQFTQLLQSELL